MLKLSNLESIGKPVYKFHNLHSVDFDGVDDFIQLGEPISYTQHTISTWVKVSDSDASKTIIDARDANDDGIRVFLTSAEVVTYQLNTSDITSGSAISVDEWHHIVATYDGTTQKLYIDGSLVSSATTSQEVSVTTNAEIGSRNFSDRANEFLGKIDELAIYDRALEEEEVTKIYRIKYGANLIQNGRFDELGSELVSSGNFSDFFVQSGDVTITNGTASFVDGGTNTNSRVNLASVLTANKTYKVVFSVTRYVAGRVQMIFGGGNTFDVDISDGVGTYTAYIVAGSSTSVSIKRDGNYPNFDFDLTSVSIKQVDPNDRWSLGTGFSFNDSKVVATNASGTYCTQAGILTTGKTYRVTFTVQNLTQGKVRFRSAGVNGTTRTANGTYTELITVNGAGFSIQGLTDAGGFTGEVTNIMAEEQKYVASNLKLNSIPYSSSNLRNYYRMGDGILDTHPLICDMVQPSLGSELVVNGNFATDSDWDKSSNWTIANNLATSDGSQTGNVSLSQPNSVGNFVTGKLYKVEFTISNYEAGVINPHVRGQASGNVSGNGLKTAYIIAGTSSNGINLYAGANFAGSISNVTAKQVNGVPGLMTNMTESDITNDVPS